MRAVKCVNGPTLTLAGPGSGKTFTLVKRIIHMIEDVGISDKEILVITFSKKASVEMRQRFENMTKGKGYSVYFCTFHAIFYSILKQYSCFNNNSVLTQNDKINYINRIMKKLKLSDTNSEGSSKYDIEFKQNILSDIARIKSIRNEDDREKAINNSYSEKEEKDTFLKIYDAYISLCMDNKKLDFDDMLYKCERLLLSKKEVLETIRKTYKYFLVDEFQDINEVQYDILNILAGNKKNIFAVGDDDQSIYGFRGSKPELMKRFMEDNRNCEIIDMNKNYRSSECIVRCAGDFINLNKNRIVKRQMAMNPDDEESGVLIKCFENALKEAEFVCQIITEMKDLGKQLNDICIIYRTDRTSSLLKEKFTILGIPFVKSAYSDGFYDSEYVKDIMAYLKVAASDYELPDLLRIINRPERNILCDDVVCFNGLENLLKDPDYETSSLNSEECRKLIKDLLFIRNMAPFAAINYILYAMGYEKYLSKCFYSSGQDEDEKTAFISEITERAKAYLNTSDWLSYVEMVSADQNDNRKHEMSDNKTEGKKAMGKVNMLTAHASKGLEFDTVFIIGMQQGIFPHKKAVSDEALEEERRLFYVAMTRAKKKLYILGRGEMQYGKKVSQFITELNVKG